MLDGWFFHEDVVVSCGGLGLVLQIVMLVSRQVVFQGFPWDLGKMLLTLSTEDRKLLSGLSDRTAIWVQYFPRTQNAGFKALTYAIRAQHAKLQPHLPHSR